uniref:EF-hand domain-containing protein n=1 Tax=Chromera velia CCMP2878 TaxID=1169474 RepID=A0A0G4FP41_9ALVE|eukprot:Cvel_3581.t1-p1 / transcript=Cvel_3581.t1 / gene=Cvel_3581 / organism=Chromera_velia_CCMP2878 / gene_product=hypothetical protein / transcript_product=hypothetical protein / location=Cvel_scaffold146:86930-90395(-) / protein_length=163 / sequence_SO=supercontig / SO=protein_coding / is_pseudo=false
MSASGKKKEQKIVSRFFSEEDLDNFALAYKILSEESKEEVLSRDAAGEWFRMLGWCFSDDDVNVILMKYHDFSGRYAANGKYPLASLIKVAETQASGRGAKRDHLLKAFEAVTGGVPSLEANRIKAVLTNGEGRMKPEEADEMLDFFGYKQYDTVDTLSVVDR